ncbi:MAG TPA: DUF885 domain-containing protein [Thermoplasmata archaeon]|nr:DUF885 domain-containing protein [Thermoplasmata archaeon]
MLRGSSGSTDLDALERAIVDQLFVLQPAYAVGLGLHEYDGRVPDLSSAGTDQWAGTTDRLLTELAGIRDANLSADRKIDRFLLRLLLEGPLFSLRESKDLDRNPMSYVGAVSLTSYLVRDYAPAADRVTAIVRTLEGVPRVLDDGRRRLTGPLPKPFIELALSMGAGLPTHFGEAESYAATVGLAERVRAPRATAEAAVARFLSWLREEQLPRAVLDFALGPARFQRLLFVREGIEAPFADMRAAGTADLRRNQARLAEIATLEGVAVAELFRRLGEDHPAASEVVATASRFVSETREFVHHHDLVTIPQPVAVRVEETPVWGRALSTASMNSPGPFDVAPEGVYYVTPVDAKWPMAQQNEWLRSLNRTMLRNITVHEVFPGHYLQFLHLRAGGGSLARKVYLSSSFVEGWAHYTEQLAIEAGLGAPAREPEVAQIHDALLRNVRLLSAIGLHTEGWSIEQATELFEREAHMEHLPAQREALRGTFDPEYFCYTLGKLAILTARKNLLGSHFHGNLKQFHDTLLGAGCPPVGLLETVLTRPAA